MRRWLLATQIERRWLLATQIERRSCFSAGLSTVSIEYDPGDRRTAILLAEYEATKLEVIERIKQRDNFINLNIIAAALIVGFAGFNGENAVAWLALPWTTLSFGWAYLANDEKVSGIAAFLRLGLGPQLAPPGLGWEVSPKRVTGKRSTHKLVQLGVDLLQFIVPTFVAITTYVALTGPGNVPVWAFGVATAEVGFALVVARLFLLSSDVTGERGRVADEAWETLYQPEE